MKELHDLLRQFERLGDEPLALASLVRATGSSYRRPGARMLIARAGTIAGSLSAGCLEEEVAAAAQDVIARGLSQLLCFDTRRRFGCHGSIDVLIERVAGDLLGGIASRVRRRESFLFATRFVGGAEGSWIADAIEPSPEVFVQQVEPAIRLLIIGGEADSAALAAQAQLLGWEPITLESISEWQGATDDRTAAVICTHNYGRDCAALRYLLPLALPYLGVIGPRRRRDELLADVLDSGAALRSNLFAPAGLHFDADSPAEIALSVVAEIQKELTRASGVSLRDRRAPIHESTACSPSPR